MNLDAFISICVLITYSLLVNPAVFGRRLLYLFAIRPRWNGCSLFAIVLQMSIPLSVRSLRALNLLSAG